MTFLSDSLAMSIHRFIESIATNRAFVHCSRTASWRSGWMLARNRTSASWDSCESLGENDSKTLRSVTSVSRSLRLSE